MQTTYCFPSSKGTRANNLSFVEIPAESGNVWWAVVMLISTGLLLWKDKIYYFLTCITSETACVDYQSSAV